MNNPVDASDFTLGEVLEAASEDLVGVARTVEGDRTTWSVGSVAFATLTGGLAEFRLDPLVAAAALRTPDTRPSARGAEWVAFAPGLLDDAAVDRAEAWFLSAHRRLGSQRAN